MQIDRHPSRGPYVAALICLLTLCLTIPMFWKSGAKLAKQRDAARAAAEFERLGSAFHGNISRVDRFTFSAANLPAYSEIDTLDGLLFRLANRPGIIQNNQSDLFEELLGKPESNDNDIDTPELHLGVVWQYVQSALHRAGSDLAAFSPSELVAATIGRCAGLEPPITLRSHTLPSRSLVLHVPHDRLALLPGREPRLSQLTVEAFPTPWCVPTALIERLGVLTEHPYSALWARQAIGEIRALTEDEQPNSIVVADHLQRLELLAAEAIEMADATGDDQLRAELLRAHWGLTRRLDCWSLMHDIAVASVADNRFAAREFWERPQSASIGQGTRPAELHELSNHLEEYERSRTPQMARSIVKQQQLLARSNDQLQRELANQIEQNYRNANVRLAVSAALLQRFVPNQQTEMSPVHDRIVGTPVRGQSITSSENKVNLHPDAGRWNVDLESTGTVDSQTVAESGQVRIYSRGSTTFSVLKSVVVERDGVRLGSCMADAHNQSTLTGISSGMDWVPLVGDLVRTRAIDEYRRKQAQARAEVEYKVARRVEQQLDDRTDQALNKVERQMREQVSEPLSSAGVEMVPIELSTTAERLIARLRVAGQGQLAGHTPRPRAPADSLASVQVHESALTNAAVGLDLDGQRLSALELQKLMREKLSRSNQPAVTLVDADTVFQFATEDAVRFRVADDRLELILAMREVDHEGSPVRNFRVHAFYVPVIRGLEAELVRDGSLGIEGRVRTGERARMHGIFNKVLSEERKLPIVRLSDPNDARLAGLMITQMVMEEGWIGLAIGPEYENRTAERSRTIR